LHGGRARTCAKQQREDKKSLHWLRLGGALAKDHEPLYGREMRYLDHEASKTEPNIVVGGSPNAGTVLTLTH
jgi:hypothetical protein